MGGQKACVWQRRDACRDGQPNSCLCISYHGIMAEILHLTARRFNELPSVSGLASFLPVPVNGRKLSRHGKADCVLVPVVTTEFTGHGAFYKRRAKNAANCASACSPTDFVSAAG